MLGRQPPWPRSCSHTYFGSHSLAEVARKNLGSSDTRSRKNIPITEFFKHPQAITLKIHSKTNKVKMRFFHHYRVNSRLRTCRRT